MQTSAGSRILVLIGAGSALFTRGLLADLIHTRDLGKWELRLVDINESALEVALKLAERMVRATGREDDIAVQAITDRRAALRGSDFVVNCVGIDIRNGRIRDWEVARKYGVMHAVGDSVMPAGISRAMQTVPVIVDIAADVHRLAPQAHFFNYSNPMTANCRAVSGRTEATVVGLCHGVADTQRELAALIGKTDEETTIYYCGINHLTFVYDFRWRGEDAWPLVREQLARERSAAKSSEAIGTQRCDISTAKRNPFSWELFERLGAYPAPGDRHTTEFFPERFGNGAYYGKTLGVDAFSIKEAISRGDQQYEVMKHQACGEAALDDEVLSHSAGEQEQLISIVRSIIADGRCSFSANVPNHGLVPNLPASAVVEVPATATGRGIRPCSALDFPAELAAIVTKKLAPTDITIEAALTGSRKLFAEALMVDGAISDPTVAKAMVEDFIEAQRANLPRFT